MKIVHLPSGLARTTFPFCLFVWVRDWRFELSMSRKPNYYYCCSAVGQIMHLSAVATPQISDWLMPLHRPYLKKNHQQLLTMAIILVEKIVGQFAIYAIILIFKAKEPNLELNLLRSTTNHLPSRVWFDDLSKLSETKLYLIIMKYAK